MSTLNFPPNSRYFGIDTKVLDSDSGRSIVYLARRFVPSADRFSLLVEHTVSLGDRLDNITALYLGDPEQFWRLCDANNAMRPQELTDTIGQTVKITLPEGIPGSQNA